MKTYRTAWYLLCATLLAAGALAFGILTARAGTATYGYDNAGRLTTSTYNDGSKVVYTLDAAGSRKSVATFGPDATPPSVPTGLTGSAIKVSEIDLQWSQSADNSNGIGVAGYNVYRNGSKIGTTTGVTATIFRDTGVSGGTSYSYTVAAFDGVPNTSAQSGAITVTTPSVGPAIPTGLTASSSANNLVSLHWTASTDAGGPGIGGYYVYRGGSQIPPPGITSTSFNDTTVVGGTTYSYTVEAYDTNGLRSGQSGAVSVTTPLGIRDSLTMVQGAATSLSGDGQAGYYTDFSPTVGQLSPTTLTGGKTVADFYDYCFGTCLIGTLTVRGFSADPGQSWLVSATAKGTTLSAGAASYGYSGGAATWTWPGPFGFTPSGTISVTVEHH